MRLHSRYQTGWFTWDFPQAELTSHVSETLDICISRKRDACEFQVLYINKRERRSEFPNQWFGNTQNCPPKRTFSCEAVSLELNVSEGRQKYCSMERSDEGPPYRVYSWLRRSFIMCTQGTNKPFSIYINGMGLMAGHGISGVVVGDKW